ncbi:MAG: proteasome subunit beta [Nitriliruptoraceae bacterium]|nr:proteasome subunit beta [Nitriliruptoraceae bacterium]
MVRPGSGSLPGIPDAFDLHRSSFFEVLRRDAPEAVPSVMGGAPLSEELRASVVEGTTVLAVIAADGVVIAGDRRATAGNLISRGDMRKVFPADSSSAIAISGAAGPAMELAKVFATELEHYEKVEGEPLSLEGKSNKLAGMVRAHLPMAMQGLVVVPLFAGVDPRTGTGRIFEYDPAGGRYVATDQAATGSGSLAARATLKRFADPQAPIGTAVRTAITALTDAAEEDSATGGPDLMRRIYPIVAIIDADGYRELDDDAVRTEIEAVLESRRR